MFKKKDKKTESQSAKVQTKKSAAKSGKVQKSKTTAKKGKTQSGNAAAKGGKAQAGKTAAQSGNTPDRSDVVLAKLMAIEKEARLEQARDRVDQLEDENIAANLEQLLKILRSGE
ncbi:MAG: hypothetical protein HFH15_04280 [Ruminococcus sp.]|nr:hypothetical protein [Ruminococcus sp.]